MKVRIGKTQSEYLLEGSVIFHVIRSLKPSISEEGLLIYKASAYFSLFHSQKTATNCIFKRLSLSLILCHFQFVLMCVAERSAVVAILNCLESYGAPWRGFETVFQFIFKFRLPLKNNMIIIHLCCYRLIPHLLDLHPPPPNNNNEIAKKRCFESKYMKNKAFLY